MAGGERGRAPGCCLQLSVLCLPGASGVCLWHAQETILQAVWQEGGCGYKQGRRGRRGASFPKVKARRGCLSPRNTRISHRHLAQDPSLMSPSQARHWHSTHMVKLKSPRVVSLGIGAGSIREAPSLPCPRELGEAEFFPHCHSAGGWEALWDHSLAPWHPQHQASSPRWLPPPRVSLCSSRRPRRPH